MKTTKTNQPKTPEQTPDTGKATHDSTRAKPGAVAVKRRGHKLTLADAENIAALVALRASESQACAVLGIPYSTWAHWKAKPHNAAQFAEVLQRINGEKIKGHMANIEKFSEKDWRASEAYLTLTMPEKYSKKAVLVEVNTVSQSPIIIGAGGETAVMKMLDAIYAKQGQIAGPAAPKQIAAVEVETERVI